MSMYDTMKRTSRIGLERRIQIDEVNPSQSYVSGKDRYGRTFRVTFDFHSPLLAIPQQDEFWTVIQYDNQWRLDRKVDDGSETTSATDLQAGDRRISTTGNFHLDADTAYINSDIEISGLLGSKSCATADRPSPTNKPGTQIYDTTLHKPLWSDGTNWRDAMGNIV